MKALVVYAYTNYAEDKKIGFAHDFGNFSGDNPTISEILTFQERHSKYPNRCEPTVINIIKLDE